MNSVFNAIYATWNQIVYAVSNMRILEDLIDILAFAFIFYKTLCFLRENRAGQLVKGLIVLFSVYLVADWLELVSLSWLLTHVMDSAIIAAAVIFQPELRRILENMGRTKFSRGQLLDDENSEVADCISSVCKAAGVMQEKKVGALIVFERSTQLGEIIKTGTIINADASVSMINNIFFPKSPLHDGAMVIRDTKLFAAGCILPLTQREDLSLQLGTRHRAAIGMTENSDAVVLVVSEETGTISIVVNGNITRNYSVVSAEAELKRLLLTDQEAQNGKNMKTVINKIVGKKNNGKGGK